MPNSLKILAINALKDNYIWALIDASQQTVVIVDPGEAEPVFNLIEQYELTPLAILITHHHSDHTQGIEEILSRYEIPVYGPANEGILLLNHLVHGDMTIKIIGFPVIFQSLAIPGHTHGHLAYYSPGMVFCGDTLFTGGCGRLFEGRADQLYASLQKLAALPDDTRIYCAHEYTLNNLRFAAAMEPGNIKITERLAHVQALRSKHHPSVPSLLQEEKDTNPFLRCHIPEIIASAEKYAGQSLTTPVEVFTWLRKLKDSF